MNSSILLVEDQSVALTLLEEVVRTTAPQYLPGFRVTRARSYMSAKNLIDTHAYGVILLDHVLPKIDQLELEQHDPVKHMIACRPLGYNLIPRIAQRSPQTLVIGTSSLPISMLPANCPVPPHVMSKKTLTLAQEDLASILKEYA